MKETLESLKRGKLEQLDLTFTHEGQSPKGLKPVYFEGIPTSLSSSTQVKILMLSASGRASRRYSMQIVHSINARRQQYCYFIQRDGFQNNSMPLPACRIVWEGVL